MTRSAAEIFHEAREMPAEKRAGYLVGACGRDLALRAKVEALLKADAEAGDFMAAPDGRALVQPDSESSHEQPGAQIGRYKLLEKIGEGGMGTIWMAEQREPVKRRVALKIIKLGMDTRQVIARFEAERQALAMMDHPNIAKVLDASATETGRPYFVMEYIKGIPILEYCDQEKIDTEARLDMFTSVCHAIQHAHQKGIIHRDIKPSNVLVTLHDGVPVPKVIDFGIAKATNSELTTKTLFTEHRQMIGTPAYMSPEQAEMSGLDIDTRSDVYSLGVLLYELLTGTTPFDAKVLLESGFAEMMRTIREVEPHKPSTRISTLGETATRTAQQRRSDVKKLSTLLRGDLDWIVMKCLEKDRTRRYDTANGLAADIKRHMNDEPVTAGAPTASYRLRKFVKRNRNQVIAAGLVVAVLVLGVIGTTAGMVRALSEKRRADEQTTKATLAAESAAKATVAAQENEQKAIAAAKSAEAAKDEQARARKRAETITRFVTATLQSSDAENNGGGQGMTILAAMDHAIADIDSGRFQDDPETEAWLKCTIGTILENNGRLQQAEPLLAQTLETIQRLHPGDHPDVAECKGMLAHVRQRLGRSVEAESLSKQALEMARRLHPGDDPEVGACLNDLAEVEQALGRPMDAEPLFVQALEMSQRLHPGDDPDVAACLGNLASVRLELGRAVEAEPLLVQALQMFRRLHPGDHPNVASQLNALANARLKLGRPAAAEPLFIEALEMRKRLFKSDHPDVAASLNNLALLWQQLGRHAEAEPLLVQSLEMQQRLYTGDHPDVAQAMGNLAEVRKSLGRLAESETLAAQALEMTQRLFKGDHPDLATRLNNLADVRALSGRYAEAEPLLIQALEMWRRLFKGDHPSIAMCLGNLARARNGMGRLVEAEALSAQALEMLQRLYKDDHVDVARALTNLATVRMELGRYAEAEPLLVQAVEMNQRLWKGDHKDVASSLKNLAHARLKSSHFAEAEPVFVQALEMYQRLSPVDDPELLECKNNLAVVYWSQQKLDQSIPLFEEILKATEAKSGRQHHNTLVSLGNLGLNYKDAGRLAEAIPLLEETYRASKYDASLAWVGAPLIDAYIKAANPGDTARVVALIQEMVAAARGTLPKDSPPLAEQLALHGRKLLSLKAWDEAEPIIREALTIREAKAPEDWRTFNTKSMLGEALLGQEKLDEAESLLLDGYRGMKEREAAIEPGGETRITEALERLVQFYEATGDTTEAAAWRGQLDAARTEQTKPTADRGER